MRKIGKETRAQKLQRRIEAGDFCSVDGCENARETSGLCKKHYTRKVRNGGPLVLTRKPAQVVIYKGYEKLCGKSVHVIVAEKALGRPLPKGSHVHHVDENPLNNAPSNLVICPNHAYHMMLHRRMRALDESGDANKRKCVLCKQWDDAKNLSFTPGKSSGRHKKCDAEYHRISNQRKKEQASDQIRK